METAERFGIGVINIDIHAYKFDSTGTQAVRYAVARRQKKNRIFLPVLIDY